ncbi:MAG: hypothetical protein NT020_04795 [Chloroflexales bacterium]|nr:hypothetical protein [Chloroflexales bacterium]
MITLPGILQVRLRAALHQHPSRDWRTAAQELSARYRGTRDGTPLIRTAIDALAYSAMLMPATFAQISGALRQTIQRAPQRYGTLLDIGSGPGTASWVVQELLPELTAITAIERDPYLQNIAQMLAGDSQLPPTTYRNQDITTCPDWQPHDIVIIAHVLNELSPAAQHAVIAKAWRATSQVLLIIEPGAADFAPIIQTARTQLIQVGGTVVAPCTHQGICQLQNAWCHFGQKVARPDFQRLARGAEMAWEEAKYSFVAISREPIAQHGHRIMHDPQRAKGYIDVVGCDYTGVHTYRIPKRDTLRYNALRHATWGNWIALTTKEES